MGLSRDRLVQDEQLLQKAKERSVNGLSCQPIKGEVKITEYCITGIGGAGAGSGKCEVYDNVNHPQHYTNSNAKCQQCSKPIECIDVTRHFSFNIGNAMKYLWRCEHKNSVLEDLRKAAWYIQDEIDKRCKEISEKFEKNNG